MKINLPVTEVERTFAPSAQIITTTDVKGRITYANPDFVQVSGFTEEELLHQSHNIVRHPDMPVEAFADLWTTLQAGKAWMGIVQNRCKNGDYYWVDAFVSPIRRGDQVVGYESVRMQPQKEQKRRAAALYQALRQKRYQPPGLRFSFGMRLFLCQGGLLLCLAGLIGCGILSSYTAGGLGLVLTWLLSQGLAQPLMKAAEQSKTIIDNDLARRVYAGTDDEVGQLLTAVCALQARLRTIVGRFDDTAVRLNRLATQTHQTAEGTSHSVARQRTETESVATATHEMASSVQDVARNAADAAQSAEHARNAATKGLDIVVATKVAIAAVAQEVKMAADVMQQLEQESSKIGVVVNVIQNIAEQTNLLALNAAIEAARAGEHGRGFAVVADEVRKLASNTQSSTQDIQHIIERLQEETRRATQVMERGCNEAEESVRKAEAAGQALNDITHAVSEITGMNLQTASAAEEQSVVTGEIDRNVHNISGTTEKLSCEAQQTAAASAELLQLADELKTLSSRFAS